MKTKSSPTTSKLPRLRVALKDVSRNEFSAAINKHLVEALSLSEETAVTVFARGDDAVVKLSPEEEADLLAVLDEADRKDGIPAADLFARLRRFDRGFKP